MGSGNPPADDNDPPVGGCKLGFMSPQAHNNWARQCFPYVKSLQLLISSAPKSTGVPWGWSNWPSAGNSSYAINGAILDQSQTGASAPAEVITLSGRVDTGREATVQPTMFYNKQALPDGGTGRACNGIDVSWLGVTFSKNVDSYAFADGHAKSMRRNAVKFRNFGVSGTVNEYQGTKTEHRPGPWHDRVAEQSQLLAGMGRVRPLQECREPNLAKPMNTRKIALVLSTLLLAGVVLSGCNSEEAVDQSAMDARNSQRTGAAGAPPAPGGAKAATPAPTTGG